MISTFIFDIGNVVWFYQELLDQLFVSCTQQTQLNPAEFKDSYLKFYKLLETNQKTLDDFSSYLNLPSSQPFYQALDQIYTEENFKNHLNYPVLNLITNLRSVVKVGFLSNAENFFYPYVHQRIEKFFDFGYSSWQLGLEKPNPEIFLKTLQLQNLKPDEVVFIDDTPKNVLAAESLGIQSIHFQSNDQFLSALQKLDIRN